MTTEPLHPGQAVRHDCLEPLTVTEGAKVLGGLCRQALNSLVNGTAGISAEMAIRLSTAFGGTPETLLQLQMACDLAREREPAIRVRSLAGVRGRQQARLL